ncbi:hypothetical protein [Arthrobacter sp.]|uniref:hypothetical protein n=1 Tax=Arthrobacter sp. TaxID=1667 RepID=UPI003A93E78B
MTQQRQTPGTGAASKSVLPVVLGLGMAFGMVRMVVRKRRDDRAAAPLAAPATRHHRHHRTDGE